MKPGTGTVAMVAATLMQAGKPLWDETEIFNSHFKTHRKRRIAEFVALAFDIVDAVNAYEPEEPEKTRPEKPWTKA